MLGAGVSLDRTFAVLLRYRRSRAARRALQALEAAVMDGRTFYEGLCDRRAAWPPHFIEVVRCSERAGMLADGLAEAAEHFRGLVRAQRSAHMLWFAPVAITLFGWLVICVLWTAFVGPRRGLEQFVTYLCLASPVTMLVLAFVRLPPLRRLVDAAVLHVPVVGETVRDLAIYQFTICLRYLYIGGVSAVQMVQGAAGAVGNRVVRDRLRSSAVNLESGHTFAEALAHSVEWPPHYIESIATAEESGQLETVLGRLAEERRDALEHRVNIVRQFTDRAAAFLTTLSIIQAILAISRVYRGCAPAF